MIFNEKYFRKKVHNLLYFVLFLFFGVNFPLVSGVYLHDMAVFCVLIALLFFDGGFYCVSIKKVKVLTFFVLFLPFFILACLDSFLLGSFDPSSFFLSFKVIWLVLVFSFISSTLNVTYFSKSFFYSFLFFISFPLIVSLVMYSSSAVESIALFVYGEEKYPNAFRYGGIFGRDVNTLGMYASLIMLLSIVLIVNRRALSGSLLLILSISCIALSGMRSGLLIVVFLLISSVFYRKIRFFSLYKTLFLLALFSFFAVLLFFQLDSQLQSIIIERFSIYRLFNDVSYGENGNLTHAAGYLESTLTGYEANWWTPLIGYSTDLMFVDNLYVFLYLKYGFFSVLLLILFFFAFLQACDNGLVKFLVVFSVIISFKGVFVFGNYYFYLCFFIVVVDQYCRLNARN